MQKIKFKSGGIIFDIHKGVLLCVGEEIDSNSSKSLLLTPGGTIKTIEVNSFDDLDVIKEQEPSIKDRDRKLEDELEEELSLTADQYDYKSIFTAESFAATDPNMRLIMYTYMITLHDNVLIRPNFIVDDKDHDVYLAIWITLNDLQETNNGYVLKQDRKLKGIDVTGSEISLDSDKFLLTAIWGENIIPKLTAQGIF